MGFRINATGFCVGWSNFSSPEPPMMNFGDAASQIVELSPAFPNHGAFFFRTYQQGSLRVSEAQRDVYVKRVPVPLAELWERYSAHSMAHKRSWARDVQMYGNLQGFFASATLNNITALRVEDYQHHSMREVAPATVNWASRELALLKHMFNMAERWSMFHGTNPVRLVKFLPEDNLKFRTVSEREERLLLQSSPPYLRELILFAINTGLHAATYST